jgi:transposase
MHMSRDDEDQFRRIEVFTGTGRRRSWTAEDKARIVEESYVEGETVSGVARRHGMTAQQLFGWRRAGRVPAGNAPPLFVPAVLAQPKQRGKQRVRAAVPRPAAIELEVDGVSRFGSGVARTRRW